MPIPFLRDIILPADPDVLRDVAMMIEALEDAWENYEGLIRVHGSFDVERKAGFTLGEIMAATDAHEEAEEKRRTPEVIRNPEYEGMSFMQAAKVCLMIHGPLTRPQIAEKIGCTSIQVQRIANDCDVSYLITRMREGWLADDEYYRVKPEATFKLVGGCVGKGSAKNPGVFALNKPEAS